MKLWNPIPHWFICTFNIFIIIEHIGNWSTGILPKMAVIASIIVLTCEGLAGFEFEHCISQPERNRYRYRIPIWVASIISVLELITILYFIYK